METNGGGFGTVDFAVLGVTLFLSLAIGIYYAISDRSDNSTENYYFGNHTLSPWPVGLSVSVSFISAITVIALPGEVYMYGTVMLWTAFAFTIPVIFVCCYYVPLFYRLNLKSIYEYLELRFNTTLRRLTSALTVFTFVIYTGITIYLPALVITAVTPLKLNWSIALTSLICTLYTTVGGIKAVVWTDVVQAVLILIGIVALQVKSLMVVGGWGNVFAALEKGHRMNFFSFDPDPTIRATTFSVVIGMTVFTCGVQCTSQALAQRYLSCKTLKQARQSMIIGSITNAVLVTICGLNGCIMFAYYKDCDPVLSKKIHKIDEIMPYMVMDVFSNMPGMSGVFVSTIYSGTLSTVSSGINSLANVILEDFYKPKRPNLSQKSYLLASKLFAFTLGIIMTATAYVVPFLGTTVVQIVVSAFGLFLGPVLATFTLGIFIPWTNSKGAIIGALVGSAVACWVCIGGLVYAPYHDIKQILPRNISGCVSNTFNATEGLTTPFIDHAMMPTAIPTSRLSLTTTLYSVSYMYHAMIGFVVALFTGVAASFMTGPNIASQADPQLFLPLFDNKFLPEKVRKFFRLGVPEIQPRKFSISENCRLEEKINLNQNGTENIE